MTFLDINRLEKGIDELGLCMTSEQITKLDRFAELLYKWNKTYNLTSIKTKEDVLTHHILDSLAVIPLLKKECSAEAKILDVGSGGGLPAIPLAIACPTFDVTMVDTVGKKAAFLTQCCVSLGLKNARALHTRVENIQGSSYEAITSRAFASLCLFTDLTSHLLTDDGRWFALKGPNIVQEIQELPADRELVEIWEVQVPFLNEKRHLLKILKK